MAATKALNVAVEYAAVESTYSGSRQANSRCALSTWRAVGPDRVGPSRAAGRPVGCLASCPRTHSVQWIQTIGKRSGRYPARSLPTLVRPLVLGPEPRRQRRSERIVNTRSE